MTAFAVRGEKAEPSGAKDELRKRQIILLVLIKNINYG
jgi:hypothetical protein